MNGKVAALVAAHQPFEFLEYPVVDPGADSILVRMRVCNICGSDIHLWRGDTVAFKEGVPQILGHEMVGTIEKLGRNVKTDALGTPLEEGDRVIYTYSRVCGTCRFCLSHEAPCPYRNKHWIHVSSNTPPHFNAGYAEFYYVEPGQDVFRVPDDLSNDLVSPLNCAAAEVTEGLSRIDLRAGDTVLVQGAGGLGLYATAMAREAGAEQIIVFDGLADRLELAKKFGADRVVNVRETSLADRLEQVLEWTGGHGADVALELAGHPAAAAEGVNLLRPGGQYLWAGNINGDETSFDPTAVVRRALRIQGIHGYEGWAIPKAINFVQRTKNKYPFEAILSHHYSFDKINDAFSLADRGEAIRVSIDFD